MVFSSLTFLFYFLPACLLAYLLIPPAILRMFPGLQLGSRYNPALKRTPLFANPIAELRNYVLLAFSIVFYAWGEVIYIFVMLFSICMNYTAGRFIAAAPTRGSKGRYLAIAIVLNLGLLFFFKYFGFALHAFEQFSGVTFDIPDRLRHLPLPLGISFFTFQAISYVIDVYRGEADVERSIFDFATYITMFPHLVAGPIVRFRVIMEELHTRVITADLFAQGVGIFILGLASKVILADTFAEPVDRIFALEAAHLTPGVAWLGAICYTFQIYFDFAGYSVMAIGLARMLGFHFPRNFDTPYVSTSVTEFWRRWHITLSTWFRDYLYIPLGGNRGSVILDWFCRVLRIPLADSARIGLGTLLNLMMVFVLCGFWHGAAWNFLVWGLYHGAFLIIERLFRNNRITKTMPRAVGHGYLLLVIIISWILFRSRDFAYAWDYLGIMFGLRAGLGYYTLPLFTNPVLLALLPFGVLFAAANIPRWNKIEARFFRSERVIFDIRVFGLSCLFLASIYLLIVRTHSPFIYFRF